LERVFLKTLGCPPKKWLAEQRIAIARPLLLSGKSIKEVGFELGFRQTSHFCRQFKEVTHTTASEYVRFSKTSGVANR
jgi:AraC-like DNA-binding protein